MHTTLASVITCAMVNLIYYSSSVSVDSYTPQDWKKLQAAVNALKTPLPTSDIELDPSAIGHFLHSDYTLSKSTPDILHVFDPDTTVCRVPSSVSHSALRSLNISEPLPPAATEKMPRKLRKNKPSSRSLKRQYIYSIAQAGDKFDDRYSGKPETRHSSLCSIGQYSTSTAENPIDSDPSSPAAKGHEKMHSFRKSHTFEVISTPKGRRSTPQTYDPIGLPPPPMQSPSSDVSSVFLKKPAPGCRTGLVRLFMHRVQEGRERERERKRERETNKQTETDKN